MWRIRKAVFPLLFTMGVVSVAFFALASGGNEWLRGEVTLKTASEGLWKNCFYVGENTYCKKIPYTDLYYSIYRAFILLAVLASLAGVVMSILGVAKKLRAAFAGLAFLLSAAFAATSLDMYESHTWKAPRQSLLKIEHGWAFILGCVGIITSALCAMLAFIWDCLGSRER